MRKPLVFISHITEEKEIAQALKALIEATFLNMVEVFVSTDPASIKPGKKWLDEITQGLKSCTVEIVLASPKSIARPWINFEAGAVWIRDVSVIPVCHSGMIPDKLPAPLSALQSAVATSEASMKTVFGVLAEAANSTSPTVDFKPFIAVVKEFEETTRQIQALEAVTPISPVDGLTAHEHATLVEVAEMASTPDERVAANQLRNRLLAAGLTGVAATLALKMLGRRDFIELATESDWNNMPFSVVSITDRGWAWMEANQDKLKLLNAAPPVAERTIADGAIGEDDIPF